MTIALSIVGCNRDYKYDDPKAVIRNRYGDVYLVYPLETKSEYSDSYVKDKPKAVLNGFKKVKEFTKVEAINPTTERSIEFAIDHYIGQNHGASTNFKLFADGSLTYSVRALKFDTVKYSFTMEATLASEIIDNAYAYFDTIKKDEEDYLSKITIENYLNIIEKQEKLVFYYDENGKSTRHNDDGQVYNAFKSLTYTFVVEGDMPEDYGSDYAKEAVTFIPLGDNEYQTISFEGGVVSYWRLYLSNNGKYVRMSFIGRDALNRSFYFQMYYSINPTRGNEIINLVKELVNK